mmetsp:Transcript_4729/g.17165  ORF Transcript_4729/g.17165 Transcript_4729/m.17165 type:complete len:218 (-) Transcript_4729:1549-2202(-)
MIRDRSHVRSDALEGIDEAGAMLNRHPAENVCVVASPDLRAKEEHAGIKPSSPPRARLYPHMRELLVEVLEDLVHSDHVPVKDFPLLVRGPRVAVDLRQVAVHVPLHVLDVGARQELSQLADDIRAHILAREVKDELVATLTAALPPVLVQSPRGMLLVELALHVHHLRLHPDAELEPEGVDVLDKGRQSSGELPPILEPVPQGGRGVFSLAEPSVV